MALAPRVLFLLCGIGGLQTGTAWPPSEHAKYGACCPKGWTHLNDHCYILKHEAETFEGAKSVCNKLGGNLVSIHSNLENMVVQGLLENGHAEFAWIGLTDTARIKHFGNDSCVCDLKHRDFQWIDGTSYDFEKFGGGKPGDRGACAGITAGGEWFVKDCTMKVPHVCLRGTRCCGRR